MAHAGVRSRGVENARLWAVGVAEGAVAAAVTLGRLLVADLGVFFDQAHDSMAKKQINHWQVIDHIK